MISIIIDFLQFDSNPAAYANVYKNGLPDSVWIKDYIVNELILISGCFIIISISIIRIVITKKVTRFIALGLYLFLLIKLIVGLYEWYSIGFDHY